MNEYSEEYMRMAIAKAKEGVDHGQTPFGACIVRDGKVLSCAHNTVWQDTDITAHAEVQAIRQACLSAGTIDLSGAVIYSTCEPCPMCFAACHWARISTIVCGTAIADAAAVGFNELSVSNEELKDLGQSPVTIVRNVCGEENLELFQQWAKRNQSEPY